MADSGRKRVNGRRVSAATRDSSVDQMGKSTRDRKPKKPKERWLLTRKTWRYMTDAGRKLIPEGALNRVEDVPKIEAYFQEVCQKEPRFLLWRKSSYPGALAFRSHRRKNRKGGSCRTKSNSADESDELARKKEILLATHTSGGRFDINKMKQDFLNKPIPSTSLGFTKRYESSRASASKTLPTTREEDLDDDEKQLVDMLDDYLKIHDSDKNVSKADDKGGTLDYQALIDKLQQHLDLVYGNEMKKSPVPTKKIESFEGDSIHRSLSETIHRYFSKSPNRQHVISDILTDRKLLEKLHFELRQKKGFRNTTVSSRYPSTSKIMPQWRSSLHTYHHADDDVEGDDENDDHSELASWKRLGKSQTIADFKKIIEPPMSPPPLIEIQSDSVDVTYKNNGIQTDPIPESLLVQLEVEYKKNQEGDGTKSPKITSPRRKSSVDHDDVSQSVSDTIKRYLRMARKKSVDSDKVDRFKRVNYDKNLRFIKAKGEITKPGDDDGLNKGCQTNEEWITIYRDLKFDELDVSLDGIGDGGDVCSRLTSSRGSFDTNASEDLLAVHEQTINPVQSPSPQGSKSPPSIPSSPSGIIASGQSFLSHLLHGKGSHTDKDKAGNSVTAGAGTMQKSKSSSSVVHHGSRVAKKIWRSRSKSQTRILPVASCTWTPQGQCTWSSASGRCVTLTDTNLQALSGVERRVLQQVAIAKLQALDLGVAVTLPPQESSSAAASIKPKRRAYLLKKKAITTSFFDNTKIKDGEKGVPIGTGLVFGIPLGQCIENDRAARAQRAGSVELGTGIASEEALRRHSSRASFSSLCDTTMATEEDSSCDSLISRERIGASVPGLLDALSASAIDLHTADDYQEVVPHMVSACLQHLEARGGLNTLGIFRVSSSKKRVRQLRDDFDSGKETIIGDDQCPHDVATLLKEYLRDLPDPLLCRDLYHAFIKTQRIRNRQLQFEAVQHLVQLLPSANRDTLYALLNFLANVAHCANDRQDQTGAWIPGNKMDSNNLATVFAPNILHCIKPNSKDTGASTERANERADVINVIRSMIDHHAHLFQVSAELLDEVYTIMMESNPEALEYILNKKSTHGVNDEIVDDLDSETSTPHSLHTAVLPTMEKISSENNLAAAVQMAEDVDIQQRKVWSREEFSHSTAGMGGPNLTMRIRHKDRDRDRGRDRFSKRRIRDDSKQQSSEIDNFKSRSSSMDSGNVFVCDSTTSSEIFRVTKEQRYSTASTISSDSQFNLDNGNVITASLKIPLQTSNSGTLSLNLDNPDIPYIEDNNNSYTMTTDGRQMMAGGPTVPPRRRQRSASGSDSSQTSMNVQPVTGSISLVQTGYDSAMGSSATFSSPPRNTPSSMSGDCTFSSPPSWASTPPTSPDSSHTTVNYIPDDSSSVHHTIYSRMTVPIKQVVSKTEMTQQAQQSAILQKVTLSSGTKIQQKPKQIEVRTYRRETSTGSVTSSMTTTTTQEVTKSASSSAVSSLSTSREIKTIEREHKFSPSITSIGGAVLRSRTADFERMTKIPSIKTESATTTQTKTKDATTSTEKKKYVKRRYTDSRHDTRHIPDSSQLEARGSVLGRSTGNIATETSTEKTTQIVEKRQQGAIYKRRELIASVPKDKRTFF